MSKSPVTSIIDVLIVGAGPAGLTLACELARRGKTISIIDKLPEPPIGSRARGLSPRSQEIFEDLGVLAELSTYAEPGLPWRIYGSNNQLVREIDPAANADVSPTPDAPYRSFLQVSQRYTDAVLRKCLASHGVDVEWDCQLVALTQQAEHVIAQVLHAGKHETIQARYLVGCDGGHSAVRKYADIPLAGSALQDQPSIFANVQVSGLSSAYWHFWSGSNPASAWNMTLQPIVRQDTWSFYTTNVKPDKDGNLPAPTLETLQRLFAERVGLPNVHFSQLSWFSIHQSSARLVQQYRSGRIFLAGDAAHVGISGGQGMNVAIQDAYNLGWKLALVLAGAPDALLDTYEAERLPIARSFMAVTAQHYARDENSSTTGEQAVARQLDFVADLFQLGLTYQDSSLSRNLASSSGIQAGQRAPDAPCLRAASGEAVRLFDLFRGPHFTLLSFGEQPMPKLPDAYKDLVRTYRIISPENESLANSETLIDADGHAFRAYEIAEHALILVRPDGYIGLTADSFEEAALSEYLRAVLGR
ncbi:FAD-binding protein [Ktedonosporobacter rubrisoli]|uniref:FAD-binding protein n=1 Tax=Ktedonosporobacter rubrisoli TaxID=2509675 RepID=A0A4P6JY97_KTERU|nr:FAD-dependent monooxygenase [Ktedonosporobacter rubrisoli]QBD80697.1 FAD-binding protein [Ktedonosporobacter rubrisoli]